jgi:hypothetical protein
MVAFYLVYALMVAMAIVVNLPGRANSDSIDMLWMAHDLGALNDWHSQFVSFVYGLLGPVFGYPSGALVVQSALLMSWPALVLVRLARANIATPQKTGLLIAWSLFCCALIALSGQIVKDVLGLGFMSVIFCVYVGRSRSPELHLTPREWGAIAAASLCLALVRSTNLLPLTICFAAYFLIVPPTRRHLAIYARATAVAAALAVCALTANQVVFPAIRATPEYSPILLDLAGISTETGKDVFEHLRDGDALPAKRPWDCYMVNQSDQFIWGECRDYAQFLDRHRKKVKQFWLSTIMRYPIAYLKNRAKFAASLMVNNGGRWSKEIMPAPPAYDGDGYIPHARAKDQLQVWKPTIAYVPFGRVAHALLSGFPSQPLLWVAVLLVSAGVSGYRNSGRPHVVPGILATGGIAYTLMIAIFSGIDNERYLLTTWFCAMASLAFLVGMIAAKFPRVDERPPPGRLLPSAPVTRGSQFGANPGPRLGDR